MAQDTIEELKVLFPKKVLINTESSEYKNFLYSDDFAFILKKRV